MRAALALGMDAVMFELKGAHLSVQRVARDFLRGERMTPARFDLMNALGRKGMRQSDLWKRLNVVRSVVCEMVRSLVKLGWVKRVRAADSRTWLVMLTRAGRAVFEELFDRHVESGNVAVAMEPGLGHGHVESDTLDVRNTIWWTCEGIVEAYRRWAPWRGPDLYCCDPEDYYFWLTWPWEIGDDLTGSAASE
ncbi:MAG TPA: MarR family transcriptional regulator [Polyangiaceae bacterium]|jgi:DNA-binding MarR family transcriptional regulator